jgi:hypothetical protein
MTAPDPTEGMPLLTALDPTAGLVEVGRLSVPGPAEDHLNLCSNYRVGAADWSRVTATSLETSEIS